MDDVSTIVVNYRTPELTSACLRHLRELGDEAPGQMIVVDNSPTERSAEMVAGSSDRAVLLPQPGNIGFAAAVNRGAEVATRPLLVLLNPDARPEPGCLRGLTDVVRARPTTAAGPSLVSPTTGRPSEPSALRRDPGLLTSLVEYTVARRIVPGDWLDRHYYLGADSVTTSPVECAMVQGACVALRRSDFLGLGGFDEERFFLYWEETDFLRRLRSAGGSVLYCPHLRCVHIGGASVGGGQDEEHFWRGLHRYHTKHSGWLLASVLRAGLAGGIAAEVAVLSCLDVLRSGRDTTLRRDLAVAQRRLHQQFRSSRTANGVAR